MYTMHTSCKSIVVAKGQLSPDVILLLKTTILAVSCQGVLNRPALLLHHASLRSADGGKCCIMLESRPIHSLVAKLPQGSLLVVHEFCATK